MLLAALEQSEQLLRGAADLGFASRPLNLFYGLSQAGRAISAAWTPRSLDKTSHGGYPATASTPPAR